jgi:hypothetical protein
MALVRANSGRYICKASQVGVGYWGLIKRFGTGFPGHSHSWLAERVLSGENAHK